MIFLVFGALALMHICVPFTLVKIILPVDETGLLDWEDVHPVA
jgi:hypothetical protein